MKNTIFSKVNRTILLLFLILVFANCIGILLIFRSYCLMDMQIRGYVKLAAKSSALLAIERNQIYYYFDSRLPGSSVHGKAYKEFFVSNENDLLFVEEFNSIMMRNDVKK